jgi:hypothetical protein
MNNFNKQTFSIATFIFGILLIPSFFAAWGNEEGTLGNNQLYVAPCKLFNILHFPTHSLLWEFFSLNPGNYIIGLLINCMFYGLLIERSVFVFKLTRSKA